MKNIYKIIIGLVILTPTLVFGAISPTSVNQGSGFINPIRIGDRIEAQYFIASSTATKSTFPYASSTVISATGICISTDCRTAWPTGGGGSGGGTWSTTTSTVAGQLVNYPNNTMDIPIIGSTSTTTAKFFFDPNTSIGYFGGNVGIGSTSPYAKLSVVGSSGVVAEKFTATSTSAISSFGGSVGVGTTSPLNKLEVSNGSIFISSPLGTGRGLVLSTDVMDDASRPGIKFLRNNFARFEGDDHAAQLYSFLTTLSSTRVFGATIRTYGPETGGFANYTSITHDGSDGVLATNIGDLVLSPVSLKTGIGTSSPLTELNVAGTLPEITLSDTDASTNLKHWFLEADSGTFAIGTTSDQSVKTNTRTFSINSSGNVGVGTTTPSAKLDIYNSNGVNTGLFVDGGAAGVTIAQFARRVSSVADLKINASSGDMQMVFSSNNIDGYSMGYDISNTSFNISSGSGVGSNDRFIVKGANVGVGTTSPYAPLSVAGFGGVVAPNYTATSTTATSTFAGGVDFRNATVQQKSTYIINISTTSPSWATTTKIFPITTLQTWTSITCFTNTGTLYVPITNNGSPLNAVNATSTVSTFAFTQNNRFVPGSKVNFSVGSPLSTPSQIGCAIDYISNI
jgi:hypothetical protein